LKPARIGAEAWTDNLKLSANSYFGMSDWHQSRDMEDYDERPADGFDVTANAYLPSLPQLGANSNTNSISVTMWPW
jgi:adhesin/invasin